MNFSVSLKDRQDFSTLPTGYDIKWFVQKYSFSVFGGPLWATAIAYGDENALWDLIASLRCGVEIYNDKAEMVWWGFVNSVDIIYNNITLSVSIDEMYNNLQVAYSLNLPGLEWNGQRANTNIVQDNNSVAVYGTKQLLVSGGSLTPTQADKLRDLVLTNRKLPVPAVQMRGGQWGDKRAILNMRGWWKTLDWKYYTSSTTATADTGTIITNLATAGNQFFTHVKPSFTTGVSASQLADGDATVKEQIEALMKEGTSNSRRVLSRVTKGRAVEFYEEPIFDRTTAYWLWSDSRITTNINTKMESYLCLVGYYVQIRDARPNRVDIGLLADLNGIFIDEAEYNAQDDTYSPTSRGMLNPWDFAAVRTML